MRLRTKSVLLGVALAVVVFVALALVVETGGEKVMIQSFGVTNYHGGLVQLFAITNRHRFTIEYKVYVKREGATEIDGVTPAGLYFSPPVPAGQVGFFGISPVREQEPWRVRIAYLKDGAQTNPRRLRAILFLRQAGFPKLANWFVSKPTPVDGPLVSPQ